MNFASFLTERESVKRKCVSIFAGGKLDSLPAKDGAEY